tara:strand:- start:81332 stop:81613 length:282 start_codon:yes stop_codon:yes gene_type:complete
MYIALAAVILLALSLPCLIFWCLCQQLLAARVRVRPLLATLVCMAFSYGTQAVFDVSLPGGQGYGIIIIALSFGWSFALLALCIVAGKGRVPY